MKLQILIEILTSKGSVGTCLQLYCTIKAPPDRSIEARARQKTMVDVDLDDGARELLVRHIEQRLNRQICEGASEGFDTVEALMECSRNFAALGYAEDADLAVLAALFCMPSDDDIDAMNPTLLMIGARLVQRLSKEHVREVTV